MQGLLVATSIKYVGAGIHTNTLTFVGQTTPIITHKGLWACTQIATPTCG